MKKITSLTALFLITAGGTSLIACGSSAPSNSADSATSGSTTTVGSAEEAIQKLRKDDADVVASCDDLVKKCESFAGDAGKGEDLCQKFGDHCDELAQQLQEARDAFEQCLQGVAQCEATAKSPADCSAQRAACNITGKDHDARRGQTLSCAQRTESCLPRGPFGRGGRDDDGDAGVNRCDMEPTDFVGCCHGGGHFGGGDAGAGQFGGLGKFGERDAGGHFGGGFQPPHGQGMQGMQGLGAAGARMTPTAPADPRRAQNQGDDAQDDSDNANSKR
jgi:hypothetical protein